MQPLVDAMVIEKNGDGDDDDDENAFGEESDGEESDGEDPEKDQAELQTIDDGPIFSFEEEDDDDDDDDDSDSDVRSNCVVGNPANSSGPACTEASLEKLEKMLFLKTKSSDVVFVQPKKQKKEPEINLVTPPRAVKATEDAASTEKHAERI